MYFLGKQKYSAVCFFDIRYYCVRYKINLPNKTLSLLWVTQIFGFFLDNHYQKKVYANFYAKKIQDH